MRQSIDLLSGASSRRSGQKRASNSMTPTGAQSRRTLAFRRTTFGLLVAGTSVVLAAALAAVLALDGWSAPELVMFGCFLVSTPWLVIGFWNAVIGFALLRFSDDPVGNVAPCVAATPIDAAVSGRHAVVMCVRHEDVRRVVRRLDAVIASLDATRYGDLFDVHVLSDSQRPEMVADEEATIAAWRATLDAPERVFYRRRASNEGFKAGNVREFLHSRGDGYETMIALDADSVMSGEAILRLVRVMQANPRLGILQSLVVGLPARTIFARVFQFGMRASMRSYSMGAAWWSGDAGPYWGHNAAIRVRAFREHCELPEVPGGAPLGGKILSHDLYEAVLMHKAGYEVRVLPEEGGSWEDNPATLSEFMRRNLRWCQGNLQYLRLIGRPGLPMMGRVNLAIAILMYVGAPAWSLFLIAGAAQAWGPPALIPATGDSNLSWGVGAGLLAAMMIVLFAPKIMGYLDVAMRASETRRYGGRNRFLSGTAVEGAFGMLFAPLVSFAVTQFMVRLFVFRRPIGWEAQNREGERVGWSEAAKSLWPATAFGAALAISLALSAPAVLPWALPVLLSFLLAVPFAVLTSYDAPSGDSALAGLLSIPEETNPPAEVRAVSDGFPGLVGSAAPMQPFRFDDGRSYSAAASPAE
ncbi:glucans biosynthesis glucosyltransferase MdoH [Hansschlegelia quercus]|uniref:Glucans biosynthesis glucosyltransferase H n=2 Tax=Hansschlegelia quercus TaxID=2528245 RepID=A0A4Q9GGB0_9HYPH|nr:glucans biosynthesis glucosyltransferase MdoH [Hansschlegelia quercus]